MWRDSSQVCEWMSVWTSPVPWCRWWSPLSALCPVLRSSWSWHSWTGSCEPSLPGYSVDSDHGGRFKNKSDRKAATLIVCLQSVCDSDEAPQHQQTERCCSESDVVGNARRVNQSGASMCEQLMRKWRPLKQLSQWHYRREGELQLPVWSLTETI